MKFFRTTCNKNFESILIVAFLFVIILTTFSKTTLAQNYNANNPIPTNIYTATTVMTPAQIQAHAVTDTENITGYSRSGGDHAVGGSEFGSVYNSTNDQTTKNALGSAMSSLYDQILPLEAKIYQDVNDMNQLESKNGLFSTDPAYIQKKAEKASYQAQVDKAVLDFKTKLNWDTTTAQTTASSSAARAAEIQAQAIYCFRLNDGISVPGCIALFSYFILYLTSWVLYVAALAFDFTIPYSLSMHDVVASFTAIQYGWEILRNLINLFFILILVYISIATILQIENYSYKKLLGKLVMAAFLINFSMFFTEIIIDVSNITALVFYKQIIIDAKIAGSGSTNNNSTSNNSTDVNSSLNNNLISFGIMQAMGLSSVWGVESKATVSTTSGAQGTNNDPATSAGGQIASQTGGQATGTLNPWTMALVGLGGSVFVLILAFIFFAATILFLLRTITLIILIITSPAAFASRVLPKTSTWWDKWWGQLTKNALFAPVYMMLMFITLKMIWGGSNKINGLMTLFVTGNTGSIQAVIFFVLLCAMLIMCLTLATSLGVMGSKTVTGWGKSLGGKAKTLSKNFAINTVTPPVSRLADMTSRSTALSKLATSNNMFGRFIGNRTLQGADKLAKAKFGGSSSYRDRVDSGKKAVEARAKLSENNLKKLPGESDTDYYNRTDFRTGDLKKKTGETDDVYNARVGEINPGMTAHGYKDGDEELKKSIALASGVRLDDKGKPVLGTYLTRGAKLAAQSKAEDITKKAKKEDGSANKQLEKLRQRLFKPADPTATGAAASPSGDMFSMAKYLKSNKLKRYANDIASKTHAGNVDDQADKMRKLFEIEHSHSMKKRERLKQAVKDASAAADIAVGPRNKMTTNNDYQRKSNDLSILQAEIEEIDKKKTELGSFLSKVDDLKLAQSQLDVMSGINTGTPPPPKP